MDAFYERLIVQAATIDELLSDDFEALPGQKDETDLAAMRLAAWCRSCASGDWALFARRLARDGLALAEILTKFANARRKASAAPPAWIFDAIWIEASLHGAETIAPALDIEPCAFEHLFTPLVKQASEILWSGIGTPALENLNQSARDCLSHSLLNELSGLSAPAIYEKFSEARKSRGTASNSKKREQGAETLHYDQFVAEMKTGGFRRLFEDKPVLLRLLAVVVRQWIDTSRKFLLRLDADLPAIRQEIFSSNDKKTIIAKIEGDLSDPHNGGYSVKIVTFTDGSRVVYKPKCLQAELAWHR